MKVVQYFKHARNLNAYKKKYKRLTYALLCVFVLCAAFVLTTYAGAETHNLENYTYVSYSQSSDIDDEETLQLLTIDESTHPVYVLQKNNIASVKVSTDKNSDGIENGIITPDTKYLKLKVEFKNIHAAILNNQYGGSFTYDLPEFFRSTSTTERPIIDDNNKVIGKIHVENGQAIVTYTKVFLESLGEHATLSGNFFLEGEVDLNTLDKDNGSIQAIFPNGSIKLEYGPHYLEKYSEVKVEKSYTKDPNSDYIKYTLTVSAGPDGSRNVYVVDKFTTNKNLVTYAGDISHTPTELGTTEDGQKPYETRNRDIAGQIYLTNQPNSDKEIPESVTDITHATLKDTLSSDIMHYIGYVEITAYEYDESSNTYKDKESKWLKIDKQKSFELKLSELGWANSYGYRFEYYAQTKDLSEIGQIKVTNTFTLNGDVVKGDQTFKFNNKTASQTTQVNGFYNLNVNKNAWYYERPVENATTWENGAFYWVIEVNGSAIRERTQIRDAVVKENNITDSYLHSDSVVGIYQGKLTTQVVAYKNYQEFLDSNKGLKDKRELFDQEYTNSKNFSGNNKSELTLTAKETIKLENDENIYMIIKTEPSKIPAVNRATFNYKNEVLLKDTTDKSFNKRNDATQSLHGGADLLKEFNFTFSYDGKEAKILQAGTDNSNSKIATKVLDQTTGNGIYASWVFKVNYAGDLKGDYRVLEDIPEGMELGYIRIKWHGNKAQSVVSKTMDGLGDDWKQYSNTATNDNGQNQSTTYYYNKNTNKALIKLGAFENKHTRDECSIDVQVVCRVTDSKVLLGGQSKTFANKVTLQDEDGEEHLATSSSTAALEKNSLDKSHLETFNGQTIKYTITANTLSQKLPSNDGNKLTLVDKLGDNLELDITSIEAKDDAGNSVQIEKAFNPETNTLEISIPNEKKIIITYTVTVNIAPDTSTKVSNKVYWKSYGNDGGKNDVIPDFSYNLNAGGSTTTTDNPHLTIKKIDQDNANPMSGVTFDIYECKLNGDKIQRVEGGTTSGETENGLYAVQAPFVTSYNTIYEVKERNTPDGYMKDDSSYYIICVDKKNSDDYTDYVKQCIAYFRKQKNMKYKVAYSSTDFNLTIYNSQKGIVVKKAFINNAAGTSHKPVSGTYRFGLYNNSQGSGSPLQVKTITYSTGETEEKTTKFINLNLNTNYYVFELDDEGNPITDTSQEVKVNKLPYVVDYKVKGNSTSKAVIGDEVIVTNSLRTKKLPSAGSRLTLIYRQLGLVMVGVSSIVLLIVYKNRDKKIKEEEIGK